MQVVLIGDAGVGKTCAVQRFKHGVYIERHGNTIGVDFMLRTVQVGGKRIKVQSGFIPVLQDINIFPREKVLSLSIFYLLRILKTF